MATSKDVIIGSRWGRWTVLEVGVYDPNSKAKKKVRKVLCQCDCGTKRYKEYRDLYDGRSLSCGCLRREQVIQRNYDKGTIEPGTRFGKLTYIKDLGYRTQKSRNKRERWGLCKCDCGTEVEVSHNNLKSGNTKSCGCVSSRGEAIIKKILNENKINYIQQYTIPGLVGCRGGALKFDFAILNKDNQLVKFIEFDGRQHYFGPDAKWAESYSLKEIQANDEIKNSYCKTHEIQLQRIPYFDIGKITLKYLGLNYDKEDDN